MAGRRSLSVGAPAEAPNNRVRLGAVLSRTAAIGEATIGTEIELKLAVRAADLPALERALAARAAGSLGRPAELVSTYFDTPDHALARRGLTLRVREGDGHFVQTVKSGPAGAGQGGALARGEWEDAIGGAGPDPQAAESGRFIAGDVADRLTPLFRTEVDRRVIELSPDAGTSIEAAIDRGRIRANGKRATERISEIELELKSGAPTALYDVALDLLAVAPVRLEWRSKAERGYRLAGGEPDAPAAAHSVPLVLDPALSGDAALQRIGLACLDQIRRNEAAVMAGLGDGIHQMRVAVRRLRAILSTFGKLLPEGERRWASEELRWLADALGPARNLDVFETSLLAPAQRALKDDSALEPLMAQAERQRRAAYRKAARAIRSTRYPGLMLRLLRWFESCGWREGEGEGAAGLAQPIEAIAARVLKDRRRVARKRSKGFAGQSAEQRHRLRIALKKLRYGAELLASLYKEKAVERFVKRVKRLQDDLGLANDVRVGHDILAELALSATGNGAIAEAGQRVLDWHEHRLAHSEPKLRKHLHRLFETEPFWRH
jgi:inorganic triphosphatase YgiF